MSDDPLRSHLLEQLRSLLEGGQAHVSYHDALADLPLSKQGVVPPGLQHSAWQVLEHLRIAQHDIVDFSDNAAGTYTPLEWPADYWPRDPAPPDASAWDRAQQQIRRDRLRFESLLASGNLTEPFPWGTGQTLLRQALLIADHNAYHLGELLALRRLLNEWNSA